MPSKQTLFATCSLLSAFILCSQLSAQFAIDEPRANDQPTHLGPDREMTVLIARGRAEPLDSLTKESFIHFAER